MNRNKTRHIPTKNSDEVKKRHFFQCAWCCQTLTERHHIEEYSKGGDHSDSNLILLCPNCHTKVHKGEITETDLKERKSSHTKNDRIAGNFITNYSCLKFKVGSNTYKNIKKAIVYKDDPILFLDVKNEQLLINLKFYNKSGELVFWMSKNAYWTSGDFEIVSSKEKLIIRDEEKDTVIQISRKNDDLLELTGKLWLGGRQIEFSPEETLVGNSVINNCTFSDCDKGLVF